MVEETLGAGSDVRIIGVIDLLGGRAVHAQGGCRHSYRSIEAAGDRVINGGAAMLARMYTDHLGIGELYLADLDAIAGGTEQDDPVRAVAAVGAPLWLDAGVSSVAQAQRALGRGAAFVIAGLETLPSFEALRDIATGISAERLAFSLDLRDGRPIVSTDVMREMAADTLAARAVDAGARSVIVLDLARVGSGRGLDLPLLGRVRRAVPGVTLLAGGGIATAEDLRRLAETGCDGALIATALHGRHGIELARHATNRFPITRR
jgi:phosphoribosylformimino-5-aminoimidazole carboxamide ribotide isomerase